MDHYDTIIIGAGHNGLTCAAYLAKHKQKVLVLEASQAPGGLAETREFHPRFKASVAHTIGHFSPLVARELELEKYGFSMETRPLPTIGLNQAGQHISIGVSAGTSDSGVQGISAEDQKSYAAYLKLMHQYADFLEPFWSKTAPGIGHNSAGELFTFASLGLKMRLLGKTKMREFMRIATLPMRDLMDENFESEALKGLLSWDGLVGSKLAPRSPNNAVLALLYRMSGRHHGAHIIPSDGMAGFINALQLSANAAGVQIRCDSPVKQITVNPVDGSLSATGVELASGEVIEAARVVSSVDPQSTFLKLVGVQNLEIDFTNRIKRLRNEGYVAKLHLALNDLPDFPGMDVPEGRLIIAPEMDAIEFAYDDAKYGECPTQLVMELVIPSIRDESLAPPGQHVLSANIMYVPYALKGGWSDERRDALYENVISILEQYSPDIRQHIIYQELLTPVDLERMYGVSGGHWHHTEFCLEQLMMMRPTYQAAQYSTPVNGLYLCGAGCHPAGDLTGIPGYNAAREILR